MKYLILVFALVMSTILHGQSQSTQLEILRSLDSLKSMTSYLKQEGDSIFGLKSNRVKKENVLKDINTFKQEFNLRFDEFLNSYIYKLSKDLTELRRNDTLFYFEETMSTINLLNTINRSIGEKWKENSTLQYEWDMAFLNLSDFKNSNIVDLTFRKHFISDKSKVSENTLSENIDILKSSLENGDSKFENFFKRALNEFQIDLISASEKVFFETEELNRLLLGFSN